MRFKSSVRNIQTFSKLTASLSSLGKVAWVQLTNDHVRFTIIPEKGTQVWAALLIDTIFDNYTLQSASENNTINLEVPIGPLNAALRSALSASAASIRLTKKDDIPLLSLTITSNTIVSGGGNAGFQFDNQEISAGDDNSYMERDRETIITQEIPVRVLSAASVEGIHEPRCREPDVHIMLPSLAQLRSISDRFTKLASSTSLSSTGASSASAPKLELAANMRGQLKLSIKTDALEIESKWEDLVNPQLNPSQFAHGEESVRNHPAEIARRKQLEDEDYEGWARVRIDGKDWSRVLSVSKLGGTVIACFCHEHALIMYVYIKNDDLDDSEESVLTYYISSFSA